MDSKRICLFIRLCILLKTASFLIYLKIWFSCSLIPNQGSQKHLLYSFSNFLCPSKSLRPFLQRVYFFGIFTYFHCLWPESSLWQFEECFILLYLSTVYISYTHTLYKDRYTDICFCIKFLLIKDDKKILNNVDSGIHSPPIFIYQRRNTNIFHNKGWHVENSWLFYNLLCY